MAVLFCFGLGYSATHLLTRAHRRFERIFATKRDPRSACLSSVPATCLAFADSVAVRAALGESSHVLSFVPPASEEDRVLARYGADFSRALWLGYCSSLSVYGDHSGRWVSEDSATRPSNARGQRRLRDESLWQDTARRLGIPCAVFRIAGIYGAQRNALDRVADGDRPAIVKHGQVFNRIHVEDLVSALEQGLARQAEGIFNICDDMPSAPQDVMRYAAQLLGQSPPRSLDFDSACAQGLLSESAQSFYRENKRAANKRMKEELGVTLRYPNYRKGLESLHEVCSSSN